MSKRSRSSSSGDTSVFSDFINASSGDPPWPESSPPPPQPPPEVPTAPMIIESEISNNNNNRYEIVRRIPPDYSKPRMFTIGSPPRDKPFELKSIWFCRFLKKCYYCKDFILYTRNIYMYSNFGAFCSEECREKQITMDEDLHGMSISPLTKTNKSRNARMITDVDLEHTKLYYRLEKKPGAS